MATFPHEPPVPLADDGSSHLLIEVGRTVRDNFHVLCGLSLVYLAVALPWLVLGTITSWAVAWAPLVLTTAPVWMTIVWCGDRMLAGEATTWRRALGTWRQLLPAGMASGIPLAVCGTVLLWMAREPSETSWGRPGLVVSAGLTLTFGVLLVPAIPVALRTGLAGIRLWQVSAAVVIKRSGQIMGALVLAVAGMGLAQAIGPVMLLGVAPLGVLVAAITLPDPD